MADPLLDNAMCAIGCAAFLALLLIAFAALLGGAYIVW